MSKRPFFLLLVVSLGVMIGWFFFRKAPASSAASVAVPPSAGRPVAPERHAPALPPATQPPPAVAGASSDEPPAILARLNAPDGSLTEDLRVLGNLLEMWQSNFLRDGNPVGENAEITAALTGQNRLELVLVPRGHPAINRAGELCDRWGSPFFFHQLSGTRMEIRSAGPDRKFHTPDDGVLTP